MDMKNLEGLIAVAREKNAIDETSDWCEGSVTYWREIKLELDEAAQEMDADKRCYLEDELGDVLWDYLNLLLCLENEGKISLEGVFERSLAKYGERIEGIKQGRAWEEIKEIQKLRLAREQDEMNRKGP